MKNAISYYYNLNPENIHLSNKNYKFVIDNKFYTLYLCNDNDNLEKTYEMNQKLLINNIYNHIIVLNINNDITTDIDNKKYILFNTYDEMNQKLVLEHIINFNYITSNLNIEQEIKWKNMWMQKIDYFEYQISEIGHKYPIIRDSISYYIGMTETAISLLNDIKIQKMCISHKRIQHNDTVFEIYNPINFVIDNQVRDVSEYFKIQFFYDNKNILDDVIHYLKTTNLSTDEIKLFFIRMLYPSYYFDMYELIINNSLEEDELLNIVKLSNDYEKLIKELYIYLSEQSLLPSIEWLKKI